MRTIIVQRFYKLSHSALDTDCEFLGPKKQGEKLSRARIELATSRYQLFAPGAIIL